MFTLGEVLDAFFNVVADGTYSDLAFFVRSGLAVQSLHQGVGEEAVGLLAALESVFGTLRGGDDRGSAASPKIDKHVLELLVPVALPLGPFDGFDSHPSGAD